MAKKRVRNPPTSFIIPHEIKEIATQAARDDRRSLSSLVLLAIEEYLAKRGYLPDSVLRPDRKSRNAKFPSPLLARSAEKPWFSTLDRR